MVGSYILEPEVSSQVYILEMSLQDIKEYDGWQGGQDFSFLFKTYLFNSKACG